MNWVMSNESVISQQNKQKAILQVYSDYENGERLAELTLGGLSLESTPQRNRETENESFLNYFYQ